MVIRYFEDLQPGTVIPLGSIGVTQEEIIAFATQYDPQPFHTDLDAARHSIFGGLVASGWHTAALLMRLAVDGMIRNAASLGSPGVDRIDWPNPVRPGDTLSGRLTVLEARVSRSKPDRGIVRTCMELTNQHDDCVMRVEGLGFYGRRPAT
jgi:acyl dehydratase